MVKGLLKDDFSSGYAYFMYLLPKSPNNYNSFADNKNISFIIQAS